ncbi:circularly permuted type 2 ATP-grasp protein [Neptunomonas phycophila]|uniref:Circularly permuted type 2 ATP-grasp protein n=1 Tax=Neptunomonas phycophila TaxID=1572645 RepID=A0AAW7XEB0_9GAMM|nr:MULTISPECIES: circularly permuted type 2 ATP-grasp protein [Neptunomonas]MDN2659793.1 circularly permuted type 2 ATP-grasp protein [Neptunomonas sp. CHC150]MDO6452315.1 circularly permuted type 2 ATP-grasp protein [Neptunomonas phycophila]MDO6466919.1 circularly permuted type 2 ATP-grasp protein [Neptunomonas phycophila]MDO6783274.1 circularly permuted type 2 ATP-grasp protein [Neptunomonas phycophila]MDP2521280.1 circularly permuted type 2 ATP-grasp protein [Neptunomonas phycophila]
MEVRNPMASIIEPTLSTSWYPASPGHYDEAYDELRLARPHWEYLIKSITTLGSAGLHDRFQKAQRILRDDGATYNLTAEPLDTKVWALDPIPMVIGSEEWNDIEAGLIERSELFDLILKDIYGPRELIRQGIIPAEIIYGHPGFLRQCHDITMPGSHNLILHAADMVRDQNGKMCIIGDRTQAPSGAGYALENRTVLSRILPSLFRDSQVHRLSLFFQSLRITLSQLASDRTDSPRIVILTPGAYSESYFEHTFLSNYLGFPLVQGSDLTVRNGHVWMKSLNGLSQVDVILRRVDDYFCDQVELKADSYLGVPGLLESARAGNVVIANPIGSGILETPALLKYLPAISNYFIGRDLQLNSVKTWWCGDKADMSYVRSHIDNLIIKPAVRRPDKPSLYGHRLTKEQKVKILKQIEAQPHNFVAQSYVAPSCLPSWQDGEIQARPSIFRTFSVSNQTAYNVMAGGLTRVGSSNSEPIVTNHSGSFSKDTWIIASEPEKQMSLIGAQPNVTHEAAQQTNLPSRVVENLFWMGRYAERAEASMRLMRTVLVQLNGIDILPEKSRAILLSCLSEQTACLPGFTTQDPALLKNPDKELMSIILDGKRPGTIKSSLLSLLMCTEQVKEMLSADTRRIINDLRDNLNELDRAYARGMPSAPDETLDPLVTSLLALSGLNHESMLRGIGWKFQEIGRRTERSLQTATLISTALSTGVDELQQQQILESVLLSVEALISFRRRYRQRGDVSHGLDLLMVDETNPRSLFYQIDQLRKYIDDLPQTASYRPGLSLEKRLIVKSLNDIQLAELDTLATVNPKTKQRDRLVMLMDNLKDQLEQLTSIISTKYFDHTAGPQQIATTQWDNDI